MDFNTDPLTATFASGVTMSNVSVPVISDDIVEGIEQFAALLMIPPSVIRGITAVNGNATIGIILDSTSKCL